MKKWIALVLVFAIMLPLCGCGKSKAVANVEALISAIGDVTVDSENAIASAQQAFDALTEEEKGKVENYFVLVEGHASLEKAREEAALEYAKEAFEHICTAWENTELIGGRLYSIWHDAVYDPAEIQSKGIQYFVDKTLLSEENFKNGIGRMIYLANNGLTQGRDNDEWSQLSEDEKDEYRDDCEWVVRNTERSRMVSICVTGLVYAYEDEGERLETIRNALDEAKENLKKLRELDENYEHYDELKEFNTLTSSFLDLCMRPTISYTQYAELENDYKKEARDYMNDLGLIFS